MLKSIQGALIFTALLLQNSGLGLKPNALVAFFLEPNESPLPPLFSTQLSIY